MARIIAWFSSGAASAVAAKIALSENPETIIAQCDLGDSEDPDNRRFSADCVRWFNAPIQSLKSEKYDNADAVFEARKYHAGINGAPCTGELKVAPRLNFQRPSDTHIWGYTADALDVARWERMQAEYPEMNQRYFHTSEDDVRAKMFAAESRNSPEPPEPESAETRRKAGEGA